ncbi:MAG TPA: glycosyltransferase family 4 protein [Candidatus Moranbacteria bacterium]|nr:glycosyltransferase family 4 protein [Candidatus Moranbacteria bacterium]
MTQENLQKKILLVTRPIAPPWDEGSKNFAFYLANKLSGFEINLMTKGILPDLPENVFQHPIYTTSLVSEFNFFEKLRCLIFQFKTKGKFDINHYFFTPTKLNSFLIKYFLAASKTKTIQTIAALRDDLWSDTDIRNLMFSDLIITYSDWAKNKLNSLGFQNVKRIYPGTDLEKYKKTEKDPALMKEKNILPSDFVINFTGEYTRLGAIDLVIDSFIEVSEKIPQIKLALAVRIKNEKDAKKKKEVIGKLKENNLLEKVSFFDNGSYTMPEVFNLCDVSLFPASNMHGKFDIPLAVVEAMACEKPVILTDLEILKELGNKNNSVIIEKDNLKQLVDAILDLYENPEKRNLIGQNARKFCEENFDIRKIAEIYEEIYKTL